MLLVSKSERPLPTRRVLDAYYTPIETARQVLSLVPGTPRSMLDPSAGRGVFGEAARELWPCAYIVGAEINPDLAAHPAYQYWDHVDFLEMRLRERFDLICTNPPYSGDNATAFIRRGLQLLNFGGHLLYLLRLTYADAHSRAEGLFAEHPPFAIHWLGRVSFEGCGDRSPYAQAVFHWVAGWQGETRFNWVRREKP